MFYNVLQYLQRLGRIHCHEIAATVPSRSYKVLSLDVYLSMTGELSFFYMTGE